jgi:hypothetical protein
VYLKPNACRCSDKFKPVCDTNRRITFHNACIAKCYGAATALKPGRCLQVTQTIERNLCPGRKPIFKKTVADTLKALITRMQTDSKKISLLDERVSHMEIKTKQLVQPIVSVLKERSTKQTALAKRLRKYKVVGPIKCPNQLKFKYVFNDKKKIAFRRCVLGSKKKLDETGPAECPAGHGLRVERVGLQVKRTCVPLITTGPKECPPTHILYAHPPISYQIKKECIKKCPTGFRMKLRLSPTGKVIRYCIFGVLTCPANQVKEFRPSLKDPRILRVVCVPAKK